MKGEIQLSSWEKIMALTREGNRETGKGGEYNKEHGQHILHNLRRHVYETQYCVQ